MRKIKEKFLYPFLFLLLASACVALMPLQSSVPPTTEQKEDGLADLLPEGEYLISPYDKIFRRIARRHNVDWRLMSAIAYGESNFRHDVVSPRGAVGIMQVMPWIAKSFDVEPDQLLNPETNIDVAARLLKSMERILRLPRDVEARDRLAFILASYNCGASRIIDARSLAKYYEEDSLSWDVVTKYLELLDEEEYYNHEAVSYGKFREASITIYYVEKVLKLYDRYTRLEKRTKKSVTP